MQMFLKLIIKIRFLIPGMLIDANEKLQKDLVRWKEIHHLHCSNRTAMAELLWRFPEFRSLVIYRNRRHPIKRRLIAVFYKPLQTLYLDAGEIGGGLYIQHGFSTMVAAKTIGENCWINQQVTVGYNGTGDPPIIGDNVTITCGAKVLGSIHVGNHVIVGANAVVIRDVPDDCTVGGVPARILKEHRV